MCDPNCPCWDDWEEDDDYATTRKKKPKKKKPPVPCHHCDPKPPSDPPPPPAPLPIYRKELTWIAKHCKSEIPSPLSHPTPIVQPLACMMFSSTSSDYSSSFPPLEPHTDSQRNVVSKPFIPSPITSTGHLEPPKPFESVLNWQTQNARAQNDTLVNINSKVEKISLRTEQLETKVDSISAQMQQIHQNLQSRIGQLDSELRAMLAHRYNGPEFDQKEREIRRLKAELAQIESEKQRPTLFTSSPLIPSIGPTYHPFASMLSPIKQYDPSKLFGMTHTLFRDNPLPPPPKPKPKPRPQPRPPPLHPSSLTIPGQPSPTFTPTSPPAPLSVPAQSKDKEPMNQFTAHAVIHSSTDDQTSDSNLAVSDSHTETDSESSASTSDSEKSYADITKILMAQPDQGQTSHTEPYVDIPSEVEEEMPESSATNQPSPAQPNPPSQKSSNGPWFTFDDLPSHKWRDRLNEMSAWIDLQMLRTGATTQSVLREFATRFTGALRDWFDSLGQYRQLQFVDLPEVSSALAVLHDQFLGDPSAVFEAARRDYLNMKCCSLNAKDLDFHYKRMSLLFYKLNGFNEPTLKHVFLASLPEELQPDIQRQLTASNLSLDNISLGKIFQLAKTCLDKLCEQKQFFKELLKDKEPFRSACKKPYLQIKCHKKKDCDCSSKKKRHFRKFKTPEFSSKPRRSRKPYRFFRKKSSPSREFKRKQSSRCFICKRKGHYAKDCPNKREKAIRLVEHLQATTDYSPAKDELEFYFSEQDEPNDETVFALQNSSDSDSDQSQVIFHQQLLSLDTTVPIPSIKLQILPSKFQRPIPAIGLIDTGAQRSMLNPHILPPEYWTQSEEHFKAVNGKLFGKPIGNLWVQLNLGPTIVNILVGLGGNLMKKDLFFHNGFGWVNSEWDSGQKLKSLVEISWKSGTNNLGPNETCTQSKDKEPMNQFTAHAVIHSSTDDQTSDSNLAVSDSHTETDSESSASTSDSEKSYADITKILMAQPDQGQTSHTEPYVDIPSEVEEEMPESSATNQPSPAQPNPPSQKSSNGPWFTFDDLPSHKWRDRLNEMSAWIDLQMLRTGATTQSVLREFATRFTGALRDWFDSLGQYRQLQFVDLPEVSSALAVLHDQFLGDPSAVFEAARRDYLNMKCCSLNAKDLDFHYKRMSLLFYKLNGFNEPTLKHVFLASLPEELQPDIQRQLTASNLSLDNISLGKIFQLAKTCLDKLCEQKQFFKELLKDKEPFRSACKKPYLQIKCHKKKDCDCSSKKKRHFRKFKTPEFSSKPRRSRKPYRFFRKKSSPSREFKRKQSSRCFICKRKGHYAKDCPNKREKAIRLVEHLQATTDYSPAKDELEFYFSEQDEPNDETVFALQNSSDSDSDQSQVIFHQQLLSLDTTVPIPSIKLQILPSKFQRPIPAIGLIDTGAQRSMLNPHILPPEYWTQSEEHFKAVNGKLFTTSLITKKSIGIQIFPNCVIWTKVIGSTLPNKDILLGFDILHQIKHLQIIPTGIRVKSMFKPFTNILKLYNLSETPQSYQDISTKLLSFCPESHSEFTHPNPLWKNKSFFIKLPFKLNEDINPTKATHPGMSPSDLLLAQQECSQLLAQGLIEPTSSQWACQAFYVEKHSEIVRGKKRLVIDYQPLNMFLQDDKFPLPRRQSMFTFLKNAQIFSKFDLKSGFWQLGIKPSERYKTAFCIPNAHFQWTVLPFGLKTAPSIFQKSMVQIFQPILHHALIYIDDIFLFSGSHEEHRNLLSQFYDIIQSHGIMLSAKKSTIATDNIEFLGMIIKDGHYQPGKHIAQELLHFPDQQLSKRQIQQFLGIINYIRDFLPHVDHHTHHLSALLKKQPPEWNADHTRAVTTLKQIAQNPPPLKLITDGKRILQKDASDESWGAILLEELNDKEHFIAYASGHFSETQKHYHSVFKEILAVKNGIKKFEYHLIGHHFLIRMDSSAFPNIFHFKGKTVPEKMLLRLKDWFSKYDFSVKHIKGSQNLIPDMLSRLSKPQGPLTLFSTTYHFPIISMATSLPPEALTKKTFPFNKTFSSVFDIQEFARKALFRFFMKAYLVTDPFPFSTFHPENLFLTGLTLDPARDTTEDVLWYIWCLTVLYATKLVLPISPTLDHLLNPDNATSLTWTLLEWFSPIPWWRKKLQQLSEIYNLDRMPAPEAQMFTSVFIIHRPYFQHPDTHLFWTQDQVYEWFTAPHIAVIENDIQDVLHNYLCQLNHQPPPLKDISHTSLGPQHDLLMIPTPSAISKPKSTGIIIKEERPDYTDFLYQDSQDPWEDFLPLSQHLHQFPQPTMDEPGPSVPGPSTQSSKRPAQPSQVDKATQTSPQYTPKCTPRDYNCPYPPCRGPSCKHPKLSKTFFQKHPHSGDTDPDETESSSEDEYMNLRSP
ncbi:hypothetical protein KPL70_003653 [Citrus sinensis]|nr:hypothetical protein KPL70_003653 [Citrus sinensis]